MAMTIVQVNIVDKMQIMAELVHSLRNDMVLTVGMHTTEGVGSLPDVDLQAGSPYFAHLTTVEVMAAKIAFDAIVTTLGDPVTPGTNAYKLLKILRNIP